LNRRPLRPELSATRSNAVPCELSRMVRVARGPVRSRGLLYFAAVLDVATWSGHETSFAIPSQHGGRTLRDRGSSRPSRHRPGRLVPALPAFGRGLMAAVDVRCGGGNARHIFDSEHDARRGRAADRQATFRSECTDAGALVVVERLVQSGGDALLKGGHRATVPIQAAPWFALSTGLGGWSVTSVRSVSCPVGITRPQSLLVVTLARLADHLGQKLRRRSASASARPKNSSPRSASP
jgi:hypothetical protein